MRHLTWVFVAWLGLSGFSVSDEVQAERKAQARLPQSGDPVWKTLSRTQVTLDEKRWLYSATHPEEVKALDGKPLTVSGYMMPLEQAEKQKHFLLTRLTPVCAFCPPGEPNEIIEVKAAQPIAFTFDVIKVTGDFSLIRDAEKGLFFSLGDARLAE